VWNRAAYSIVWHSYSNPSLKNDMRWVVLLSDCYFFLSGTTAQRGPGPPHSWGFCITHSDTSQSVGLLWTKDRPVAETSASQHKNTHKKRTFSPPSPRPEGFEPAVPASEWPQTIPLDFSASGIDRLCFWTLYHHNGATSRRFWRRRTVTELRQIRIERIL
jgi:hypothetical protein